jgi:hypothetical protein
MMQREIGSMDSPIWLLGDSNPKNWADALEAPLDPRHPARHSIWTSVLDVIQDKVYKEARLRVDTSNLFIRNAIEDPKYKPLGSKIIWQNPVVDQVMDHRGLLVNHHPILLFCFGAFAYEFARRVMAESPEFAYSHWGAKNLGNDFLFRASSVDSNQVNIFPLLHVTIARGKFIQSHRYFTNSQDGNYFEFVGRQIADVLLLYREQLRIWIE